MKAKAVMPRGLFSLLCIVSFGVLRADATPTDPMYSFSGVYGTYDVSISFDTSLTGAALDNLTSDNITSTVSNFMETSTIPGHGSAALNVTISTVPTKYSDPPAIIEVDQILRTREARRPTAVCIITTNVRLRDRVSPLSTSAGL